MSKIVKKSAFCVLEYEYLEGVCALTTDRNLIRACVNRDRD